MFSRKAVLKQLDTSDDEHEDSVLSSDSEEEEEDTLSPPQQTVRTSTPFLPQIGLKRKLNYQPESTTKSLVTRKGGPYKSKSHQVNKENRRSVPSGSRHFEYDLVSLVVWKFYLVSIIL